MIKFTMPKAEIVRWNTTDYRDLANIARVCYKSEAKSTPETDEKLLRNCIKNGHHTILEHMVVTFKLTTNRAVTHGLVRHRLASPTQESTQFVCSKDCLEIVPFVWMQETCFDELKDNRLISVNPVQDYYERWRDGYKDNSQLDRMFSYYDIICRRYVELERSHGRAQASCVLSNDTKAEIYFTMNLRELRHFFHMRIDKADRPETKQVISLLYKEVIKDIPEWLVADAIREGELC